MATSTRPPQRLAAAPAPRSAPPAPRDAAFAQRSAPVPQDAARRPAAHPVPWAAVAIMFLVGLAGLVASGGPGLLFLIGLCVAAAGTAAVVPRRRLLPLVVAVPLVYAALVAADTVLHPVGGSSFVISHLLGAVTNAVQSGPAVVLATLLAAGVAGARGGLRPAR